MSYCSGCGQQVTGEYRFCTHCGTPVAAETPPAVEPDAVPRWLGWLAVPIILLTSIVGLALYSYWAFRRGRRDGVGRGPGGEPHPAFAWRAAGWALVAFIPVIGWYAAVHLPTVSYRHGLRVGYQSAKASKGFTSLTSLAGAFAGIAVAAFGALILTSLAIVIAEGGERVTDLRWEVLAPNTGQVVVPPGITATFGLRTRDEHDPYGLRIEVTDPSGLAWEAVTDIEGSEWSLATYPGEFEGEFGIPSTDEPGLYMSTFFVESVAVAEDSFTVEREPPNTAIDYFLDPPFQTSAGDWVFNATVMNNSTWTAADAIIELELTDGSGRVVKSVNQPIGDVRPGEVVDVNVVILPPSLAWELYSSEVTWFWELR